MTFWEFLDRNGSGVAFLVYVTIFFTFVTVIILGDERPQCDEAAEVRE